MRILFKYSTILLSGLNIYCLLFWLISTIYLGWIPTYNEPDPKFMYDDYTAKGIIELKEIVRYGYRGASYVMLFIYLLFPIQVFFLISYLFIERRTLDLTLVKIGVIAILISMYLFFDGTYLEWIAD